MISVEKICNACWMLYTVWLPGLGKMCYTNTLSVCLVHWISLSEIRKWLQARLQYLQCISNGDTPVLQQTFIIIMWGVITHPCHDLYCCLCCYAIISILEQSQFCSFSGQHSSTFPQGCFLTTEHWSIWLSIPCFMGWSLWCLIDAFMINECARFSSDWMWIRQNISSFISNPLRKCYTF